MDTKNLEARLEKLEQQIQKRIDRQNLFATIISHQLEQLSLNTHLLISLLPPSVDLEPLSQFYLKQIEDYQQLKQQLSPDDDTGRDYLNTLITDLQQIHCQLTGKN